MEKQKIFKIELEEYYNHLVDRFEKGFRYLEENPTSEKAIDTYNNIIAEVKFIEELRIFYNK